MLACAQEGVLHPLGDFDDNIVVAISVTMDGKCIKFSQSSKKCVTTESQLKIYLVNLRVVICHGLKV